MITHLDEKELKLSSCHVFLFQFFLLTGDLLDNLLRLVLLHHPHRNHRGGILGLVCIDKSERTDSTHYIWHFQLDSTDEQVKVALRIEQLDRLLINRVTFVGVANLEHHNEQWWLDLTLFELILRTLPVSQQIPNVTVVVDRCFLQFFVLEVHYLEESEELLVDAFCIDAYFL